MGGLLKVVDRDEPKPREPVAEVTTVDRVDGQRCEVGSIRLARPRHSDDVEVLGEEVGGSTPFRNVGLERERPHLAQGDAVFGDAGVEVAQLGTEPAQFANLGPEVWGPVGPGALGEVPRDQLGEVVVLLAAGDEAKRMPARLQCGGRRDLEGERGGRPGHRPVRGAFESGGDPVSQHRGRRPARRQREHRFGIPPTPEHPIGDEFDERGGLARARRADH